MTIATDMGFEIGKLYRVIKGVAQLYYQEDMVVEFIEDDGTLYPYFKLVSGTPKERTIDNCFYVDLEDLESVEPEAYPAVNDNKSILLLYIQQQYPDDKVLKALVESL